MTITRARFGLALEQIKPADWSVFEQLSSTFLVSEFSNIRTLATASGDGGRDSEIFHSREEPSVAIQYSVTSNWASKIRSTIGTLNKNFPDVHSLIYLTNQVIGAKADDLKKEFRKNRFDLDVRDATWFLDRANSDRSREQAAEEISVKFVDPLLPSREIDRRLVAGLSNEEAKTALLFLEMQIQDSSKNHGLTKTSYEALTLAALRDTTTSNRMSRLEIHAKVGSFLPTHAKGIVNARVDAALVRLARSAIRHRKDNDEFHLRDEERSRVVDAAARVDVLRKNFEKDLTEALKATTGIKITDIDKFISFARQVLESYFLRKGEDFARAAVNHEPHKLDEVTLRSVAQSMALPSIGVSGRNPIQLTYGVLENVLASPSSKTDEYLNLLLQSYTLFAFLAATPDVQKATRNMFGSGEIWLDTTAVLPLFAEVSSDASRRPLTAMFAQCRNAGLRLFITNGVIEEVERHINRCRAFTRSERWDGDVPFLYAAFAFHGGKRDGFSGWVERFSGERDPIQDIADYLLRKHNIKVGSATACEHVEEDLARAVRDVWREIHVSRRGSDLQALRLAEHDAENYLHILSSRIGQKGRAPLGYSDWWLTLDGAARSILERVDARLRPRINVGPVISIDYLLRYLAFGPARDKTDFSGSALSKIYAGTILESIPPDLLKIVDRIRTSHDGLEEHIIERRIRDGLNDERSRIGNVQSAGLSGAIAAIDKIY